MPAYWVARTRLRDLTEEGRAALQRYAEIVAECLPQHPFKTLSRSPTADILEGTTHFDHYYLHEFPSKAAAVAFYYSPRYQEAVAIRAQYCQTELVILDGIDSTTLP